MRMLIVFLMICFCMSSTAMAAQATSVEAPQTREGAENKVIQPTKWPK